MINLLSEISISPGEREESNLSDIEDMRRETGYRKPDRLRIIFYKYQVKGVKYSKPLIRGLE